jgi:hypothetical protein
MTTFLFLSLSFILQERWRTRPALDQKGRKRIGQLSNGIDLTTQQQVQQASNERLPLDEHSQKVSKLLNDKLRDGAIRLSRRRRIHHGKVEEGKMKTFDDKILFFVTI